MGAEHMLRGQPGNAGQFAGTTRSESDVPEVESSTESLALLEDLNEFDLDTWEPDEMMDEHALTDYVGDQRIYATGDPRAPYVRITRGFTVRATNEDGVFLTSDQADERDDAMYHTFRVVEAVTFTKRDEPDASWNGRHRVTEVMDMHDDFDSAEDARDNAATMGEDNGWAQVDVADMVRDCGYTPDVDASAQTASAQIREVESSAAAKVGSWPATEPLDLCEYRGGAKTFVTGDSEIPYVTAYHGYTVNAYHPFSNMELTNEDVAELEDGWEPVYRVGTQTFYVGHTEPEDIEGSEVIRTVPDLDGVEGDFDDFSDAYEECNGAADFEQWESIDVKFALEQMHERLG